MGKQLTIESINEWLKASKIPVRVRRHGDALCLRATLPPKPGSGHTENHRYDLSLGLLASQDGLQRAKLEVQRLGSLLAMGRFDWGLYLDEPGPEKRTIAQWIEGFRREYRATHTLADSTWERHWQTVYDRLPQNALLKPEVLLEAVFATEADTHHRKETCKKLQKLIDYSNLRIDLLKYQGSYSSNRPQVLREPPADALIAEWRDRIPTESWRWFYGVCAVFGLRPHEAFFCQMESPYLLRVLKGKTGPRLVRAFYQEWSDRWNLINADPPAVHGDTFRIYGERASRQFNRYDVPFDPYDLRHRYAIRLSVDFRLPVPIAAKEMGHSPTIHWNTYQRWISRQEQDRVYAEAMADPDRPQAP
ncbi:integrase [Leptolyngbya sp. FACHB-36]|uniref:integrase n=1 Tax=Leptolyngbya sp. FACHB-36 TaxID=2692808 RepID=UPI0016801A97|nr:integrase [Leptolyngbya sp. FACHB-36]MBD2020871.1 integrase [Leptolyngbya sp. FACHB-36]